LTLACDASPRPLFFCPPRGARTGLKQRVPRPGHPRAGYVNVLGRDFEVETTRHLPALPRPFARRSTMQLTVAYRGRSGIVSGPGGLAVALAPNLRRDRVSYVGALRSPLRFREAVSALHDVVVSDLRFKPKDKSAYEAYKAEEKQREEAL